MYELIKGIIIAPSSTLKQVTENTKFDKFIYGIFFITFLIPLTESFLAGWKLKEYEFEGFGHLLNKVFHYLTNPTISLLANYLIYFCFLLVLFGLFKLTMTAQSRKLFLTMMSLSTLGLIAQPVYLIYYILVMNLGEIQFLNFILGYGFKIWNIYLFFLGMKIVSGASFLKLSLFFVILFSISFFLTPFGLFAGFGPYLFYVLG
jgi:hypothetical protein